MGSMIVQPPQPVNSTTPGTPVPGSATGPVQSGWYLAKVVSYSAPNAVVRMTPIDLLGYTLTLPNYTGQTLTAGQTVAVLGSGSSADVIV